MVVLPFVSLVVGLFPTIGPTKKALIPTPGLSSSPTMLFRLIIYVENIENLTYVASTKKPGIPTLFRKKKNNNNNNNRRYCFTQSSGLFPQTSSGRMVADKKEQGF